MKLWNDMSLKINGWLTQYIHQKTIQQKRTRTKSSNKLQRWRMKNENETTEANCRKCCIFCPWRTFAELNLGGGEKKTHNDVNTSCMRQVWNRRQVKNSRAHENKLWEEGVCVPGGAVTNAELRRVRNSPERNDSKDPADIYSKDQGGTLKYFHQAILKIFFFPLLYAAETRQLNSFLWGRAGSGARLLGEHTWLLLEPQLCLWVGERRRGGVEGWRSSLCHLSKRRFSEFDLSARRPRPNTKTLMLTRVTPGPRCLSFTLIKCIKAAAHAIRPPSHVGAHRTHAAYTNSQAAGVCIQINQAVYNSTTPTVSVWSRTYLKVWLWVLSKKRKQLC